jgi:23S rRNA (guanosine2251-2'-O)-methyltransferase
MWEVIYGRNAVYEALRAGRRRCQSLLVAEGIQEKGTAAQILTWAQERQIPVRRVPRQQLEQLGPVTHQGMAGQFAPYPYADVEAMLNLARERKEMPLLLLLDCLQDPQNLGSLLRTAEVVEHRAAEVTPAVVHASAGAVEHLLVAKVTNLVRAMQELKQHGIWVVGLEYIAEAQEFDQADLNMPVALVVGSEGQGLGRLVRERCDLWIKLPMQGQVNSLNASVAGSVALYEAWRQRRSRGKEATTA